MPHTTAPPGKSINIWKTMKAITTTTCAGTGARTPRAALQLGLGIATT